MWQQWLSAVLGLWLIAIPFLGIRGAALVWALVVTGVAVAILGIWGAQQEQSIEEELHDLQLQRR